MIELPKLPKELRAGSGGSGALGKVYQFGEGGGVRHVSRERPLYRERL